MHRFPKCILTIAFALFGTFAACGQQTSAEWLAAIQNLPTISSLVSFLKLSAPEPAALPAGAASDAKADKGTCSVAPLDPIQDPAAQRLEAGNAPADVVDVADMQPAAARALNRFETRVARAGGTLVLKSAYRPAAYQKHLQDVWYKWMNELRDNHDPGCQDLRAQVQQEFARHRLIETQHPVAVSDHTRGLAFDATVELPPSSKHGRRPPTLDVLARLAGLFRPAIAADPVHFKYVGWTRYASARRQHNA